MPATLHQVVRVMMDTSSVRNLEPRPQGLAVVRAAIDRGRVRMVIPRAVSEQLWEGHRRGHGPGTPPFPCEYVGNTLGRCGLMASGDSLGKGDHFDAHLGSATSRRRIPDALIADAAAHHAQMLVSDDSDFLRQPETLLPLVRVMDLATFLGWIDGADQPNEQAGVAPVEDGP